MRRPTERESEVCQKIFRAEPARIISQNKSIYQAYQYGFLSGLDYAQRKLDAYAAYVAGKITLKELEEVLNA